MRTAAHGPRGHAHSSKWGAADSLDPLCFFLIAVGYKVPWTAISSLLHQISTAFQQPKVLLWLNLAYFVPSMPALLLHSSLQDCLEYRLGVPTAALARFAAGLGALAVLALAFPAASSSLGSLLGVTAAVGVAYSIAFGTSHQLAPRFSARSTVALNTGFVSCGVVVLLADLALKPSSASYTPAGLNRLFQVVSAQTLLGLLSAVWLLRRHWRRLAAAGKQQQHQVIGLLPPSGSSMFGRVGSAGSNGSSGRSQLLLPPRGWANGHIGGAVGFRHVNSHTADSGSIPATTGHGSFSGQHQQQCDAGSSHSYGQHQQQCDAGSSHSYSSGASAALTVHVTVSSDDGSGSSNSNSNSPGSGPMGVNGQQPGLIHQTSSRWDLSHGKKARVDSSSSSSSSKGRGGGGGIRQRLRPLQLLLQLAWRIWPAWLALLMSVGSSMLVFPLFTCVDTTGRLGQRLPQVLFYARLLGDILGRMVPPAWQLRSSKSVLTAAFFKTKLLVVLVPAILQPSLVGGDLALAALVACNWLLSGYINTGAYLLAPRLATGEEAGQQGLLAGSGFGGKGTGWRGVWGFRRRARLAQTGKDHGLPGRGGGAGSSGREGGGGGRALSGVGATALRSKAGAVMSLCFQVSCFVGLLGAWVIQEILHESGHPAFEGAGKAAGLAAAAAAAMKAAGRQVGGASTAAAAGAAAAAASGPGTEPAAAGTGGGFMGAAAAAFAAAAAAVTRSGGAPAAAQEAL